jgi:hypothetical protein
LLQDSQALPTRLSGKDRMRVKQRLETYSKIFISD